MEQFRIRKNSLVAATESIDSVPVLLVGCCACGHTFFPAHGFGCESCGAGPESIDVKKFKAKGRLRSHTIAHHRVRLNGKGPMAVGHIIIDKGPAILAILETDCEKEISERRVIGKLVETGKDKNGNPIMDLFFTPQGGAQ